ncbi:hypothetical protein GCM10027294_07170 [Marinactinospora endophytica]
MSERACALDHGWLLVVDYATGRTRLLAPAVADRWREASAEPPVPRVPWEPSWSTHEVPLGWEPPPRVSARALLAAGLGVVVMLIVATIGARRRRMRRMVGLVRRASSIPRCIATSALAEETVNAVRHFGFLPGRMACLESSVAAVVAIALQGRAVAWHHGVRCDPIVLHAWISVGGTPVAEPPSTRRCAKLLTIAPEKNKEHV